MPQSATPSCGCFRLPGRTVEVQNYIDNTGVQVADVIVGLKHVERKSLEDVRRMIADKAIQFDYYCWDVYARVTPFYEAEDPKHALRGQTLKEIEEGNNDTARMAEVVAMTIVGCHLRTMRRINVAYDLLPRESDILHLKFWDYAFQQLKAKEAIFFEKEGKNAGCWVMRLEAEGHEDDKIIVRSNGTVTYVGKDIAYQLWKLGLLNQDFKYELFDPAADVWVTASAGGQSEHPRLRSRAHRVQRYRRPAVVSAEHRRSRPDRPWLRRAGPAVHSFLVRSGGPDAGLRGAAWYRMSRRRQKTRDTLKCPVEKARASKRTILLNTLESEAKKEVVKRNPELMPAEAETIARQIAVGALRYFLLKFTRTAIIAFDFKEALNFDGETGPYIQYAAVRGNNIIQKLREADPSFDLGRVNQMLNDPKLASFLNGASDIWELLYTALRLDEIGNQVIGTLEPASLAKYAFGLAQRFNLFYHNYRIVSETDPDRRLFYVLVVDLVREALTKALDLMGIEVPRRM